MLRVRAPIGLQNKWELNWTELVAGSIFGPISQTHISKSDFKIEISSSALLDRNLGVFLRFWVEAEVNFFRREKLCRRDYLDYLTNRAKSGDMAVLELTFRNMGLGKWSKNWSCYQRNFVVQTHWFDSWFNGSDTFVVQTQYSDYLANRADQKNEGPR